ncbi:MAG: single-stranded DNA-binding protein [Treponema sp.]|nr:single-stranded DNA-binding protein [Treponema sp.]
MNAMNQVILEGNVVRMPAVKDTPRGTRFCTLPIAVNRIYKDKEGHDVNEVGYYDVEAWGEKLANIIEKCGFKGRGVRVVGRLKQNRWKTTDGKTMSKILVVAEHVDFRPVFRKKDGESDAADLEPVTASSDGDMDESSEISNLEEAAAGIRAEQEVGETVF